MLLRRIAICSTLAVALIAGPVTAAPVAHAAPVAAEAGCSATMPKVTLGLGVYVSACGGVWTAFAAAALVEGGGAVTVGCAVLETRSRIAAVLCELGGNKALEWGIRLAKKVLADRKLDSARCYQVKYGAGKPTLKSVRLKHCR
jgi:hypothetical protein